MGVDREYRIRITTVTDPSGAGKARGALGQVGEEAEKANVSHREMRKLLRMMGPEFAEFGYVGMMALHNHTLIPLLAVGVAMEALREHTKKLKEEMEAMAEAGRKEAKVLEDGYWLGRQQLVELQAEHDSWIAALVKGSDDVKGALDREINKIKEVGEANKKVMEERKKDAEEEIKLKVALGEYTDSEGKARLAQIENINREADSRAAKKTRAEEIAAAEKALADLEKRYKAAEGTAGRAMRESEKTAGEGAALPGQIELAKEERDKSDKAAEEAERKLREAERVAQMGMGGSFGQPVVLDNLNKLRRAAEEAAANALGPATHLQALQEQEIESKRQEAERKRNEKDLQESAKKLKEEFESLQKKLQDMKTMDQLKGRAEDDANKAARSAAANKLVTDQMNSPEGKLVHNVIRSESALAHGDKITVQQQAEIATLRQLLAATGQNGDIVLAALRQGAINQVEQKQQLREILAMLQNAGKQNRNAQSP